MATPERPVSGTPIASVWGQGVHDAQFTPIGGSFLATAEINHANPITLRAVEDPAGFLSPDPTRLIVPAGCAGLYLLNATVQPSVSEANRNYRFLISSGGVRLGGTLAYPTSTFVDWVIEATALAYLAEGIDVFVFMPGGTGTAKFNLLSFRLMKLADSFGA